MIPSFDMSGVLPPHNGVDPTNPLNMSPYPATMVEVVGRFAYSHERRTILTGLLNYRRDLMAAGLCDAFQWIDGSFVEDIENTDSRSPNDVDIVTFFRRPVSDAQWQGWAEANAGLFTPDATKRVYKCDAYGVDLGLEPEHIVGHTHYWFGLFSHRRITNLWKGIVRVQLDAADDALALELLLSQTQ